MDFELDSEHVLLRDTVRHFAQRELGPLAERIDREDWFPPDIFPRLGQLGVLGINVPSAYGGAGADLLAGVLVIEELARVSPSIALSYGAHANLCTFNLYRNGNEQQRQRYLPMLCAGTSIGALALTEPNAGSDAVGIQTRAVREGDHYVVNGTKMFITNAPVAEVFILYAKTAPERGSHGISAFIIERDFPGFRVARALEKYGHRGSPTGELVLQNCVVPAANLLGAENEGVAVMMSGLDLERAFLAGECLGIAEGAFELALRYAREREQFGQPIGSFQLIQAKLADMYTQIEAARWLVYRTAALAQTGRRIRKEAAAAILFAAEMSTRVADQAVQIHGGYGYTLEFPVQRYLRDAKLLEIGAGTSEIRRLLIGRELLQEAP